MQYNINTIDDIDHNKGNTFLIHDLFIRPIKPKEVEHFKGKDYDLEYIIEKYKNDEYNDEDEKYEDQEKIHNALRNVDMRKLSKDPNVIKGVSEDGDSGPVNDYLGKHLTRLERHGYGIPQEYCEMYIIEYIDFDCLVTVLFLEFKKIELLTKEIICDKRPDYVTIKNCMQWHPFKMDHMNINEFTQYNLFFLNKLIKKIEKPQENLYLTELPFKNKIKTKLYNYQLNNVNWMIDYENNPIKDKYIMNDKLVFMPDGRVWNYNEDRFITDEDPIIEVRGGIIMDEVGIGKTLQALCLAYSTPELKTLIVVPDHLTTHWKSELALHFKDSNIDYINIIKRGSYIRYRGKYDRIIFDEIHELYFEKDSEEDYMDTILFRKAIFDNCKHKWGITATPFVVEDGLFHIMRFLTCQGQKKDGYLSKDYDTRDFTYEPMVMYAHLQYIYEKIFKRNTLESIKNEIYLPDTIINNVMVKFNELEQMSYNTEKLSNCNEDDLRKFCCDLSLNFEQQNINITFDQFKNSIIEIFERKLINEEEKYNKINSYCIYDVNKNEHEYYKQLLIHQTEIVNKRKDALKLLKTRVNNLFKCVICSCDVDTNEPFSIITSCNHVYCTDCITIWVSQQTNNKCPTCTRPFKKNELCHIKTNDNNNNECVKEKYAQFSSKIKALLTYLETVNDKVIIYTQYDSFINKNMLILNTQNIKSMIFKTSDDVQDFKNNDCKVMFLSSIKNTSGIDLSYVNKVIILEPIKNENHKFVKDIEVQIIGRTRRINQKEKITVTRFIIENTIEEEIYNKCKILD